MEKDGQPIIANVQESLEDFERFVYERNHPEGLMALYRILRSLRKGVSFKGYGRIDGTQITRLAGAATALFADPTLKLSQKGFDLIASEYGLLDAVFRVSGFETSEHLYRTIRENDEGLNRYLLVYPWDSQLPLDLKSCFSKDPQATLALYFGMLCNAQAFVQTTDERREMLLQCHELFQDVSLTTDHFNSIAQAYMHCSYAHGRGKHDVKKTIHGIMRKMLLPEVQENHAPLIPKDRPTVMVMLEWWWDKHAMYRVYAKSIEQLKSHFRLVGMCRGENSNETGRAMFDEFVELPNDSMILTELVDKVRAVNPDIIYYPSIGMTIWTIALSSLRLAPIQVMSYGHPATSRSPMIDYGIIEDSVVSEELYSELLIKIPEKALQYHKNNSGEAKHWPRKLGPGDKLKIAIPAMQCKISWPFVQALQQIEQRAPRGVEFHFFPYVNSISMLNFGKQIEGLLKHKAIYESAQYHEYMGWVSNCDLSLFSFPFGGTNSTVDACVLGQPMVALEGEEMHSRTDAMVMRRAGLPEWLIAKDVESYVETVLKLFDDDVRESVAEVVRGADLESTLFAADEDKHFLSVFLDLYNRHAVRKAA